MKDKTTLIFISSHFRKFMLPFQTDAPMIHVLHIKLIKLFTDILKKFVDSNHLCKQNGKSPLSISEYIELQFKDEAKHKAKCDIGTKATSLLSQFDALEMKKFYKNTKNFLIECAHYLQQKLPLD